MSSGSAPQSTDRRIGSTSRAFVVYDRTTGEILHIHNSVAFPHGVPERESPAARARRLAGAKAGANAEILEVETADVNHRKPIRIDLAKRAVVRKV